MNEKCRLCLKQDGSFMKIFNNALDCDIHSNIMTCIGISIKENDGITNLICAQCFYLVKAFTELRTAAIKNDMLLKSELLQMKIVENVTLSKEEVRKEEPTTTPNTNDIVNNTQPKPIPKTIIKITNDEAKVTSKQTSSNEADVQKQKSTKVNNTPDASTAQSSTTENQTSFMSNLQLEKKSPLKEQPVKRRTSKIHPSVLRIRRIYPGTKLSRKLLKTDFDPKVLVNRKIVDDFVKHMNSEKVVSETDKENSANNKTWTVSVACENNSLSLSLTRVPENLKQLLSDFENKTGDNESVHSGKSDSTYCDPSYDHLYDEENSEDDDLSDTSYSPGHYKNNRWSNKSRKRSLKTKYARIKRSRRISSYSESESHTKGSEISSSDKTEIIEKNNPETSKFKIGDVPIETSVDLMTQMLSEFLPKENVTSVNENNQSKSNKVVTTDENNKLENDSAPIDELLVPTKHADKTFICHTCNLVFDSQKLLKEHKNQHPKGNLHCPSCSASFQIVEDLVKHNIEVHTNQNANTESLPSNMLTKEVKQTVRKRTVENLGNHNIEVHANQNANTESLPSNLQTKEVKKTARKSTSKPSSSKPNPLSILKRNVKMDSTLKQQSCENLQVKQIKEVPLKSLDLVEKLVNNKLNNAGPQLQKSQSLPVIDETIVLSDDESIANSSKKQDSIPVQKQIQPQPKPRHNAATSTVISDEDRLFKEILKKHQQKRKIVENNTQPTKINKHCRNVILQGIDKILEKSYIPVDLLPHDSKHMALKYVSAISKRRTVICPKNTSYSWNGEEGVKPPKNPVVKVLKDIPTRQEVIKLPTPSVIKKAEPAPTSSNQVNTTRSSTTSSPNQISAVRSSPSSNLVSFTNNAKTSNSLTQNKSSDTSGHVVHNSRTNQQVISRNRPLHPQYRPVGDSANQQYQNNQLVRVSNQQLNQHNHQLNQQNLHLYQENQHVNPQAVKSFSNTNGTRGPLVMSTAQQHISNDVTTVNNQNVPSMNNQMINSNSLLKSQVQPQPCTSTINIIDKQLSDIISQNLNRNILLQNQNNPNNPFSNLQQPSQSVSQYNNQQYQNSTVEAMPNYASLHQANINVQQSITYIDVTGQRESIPTDSIERRPVLKVRNIAELTNTSTNGNEIRKSYTQSLSEYLNTVQPQVQNNFTDEYVQI